MFLTSVFTHMLPPSVRRYLNEIRRVVKPGGRVLATFFPDSAGRRRAARGSRPGYRTSNRIVPGAVAYEGSVVREWFRASGLTIVEPIHRGSWTNFEHGITCRTSSSRAG